ncbi:MAG: ABC transporter permease [Zavarzinia sp.]|nr:ABC transporter permease [Zavarzinia sp.]
MSTPSSPRRAAAFMHALVAHPSGAFASVCVGFLILVAVFAPLIAPYDPTGIDILARLQGPSLAHPLGTDQLGRDVLSRIIFGTRTALLASTVALGASVVLGTLFGLIAGYGPRLLDKLLMLVFDSIKSLPLLIMALALGAVLGPSLTTVIIVVIIFTMPAYARLVRSQALVLKQSEYVLAARAMGAPITRVMFRHILPNLFGPLIVLVCMDVTMVITVESGLSFIGLGTQPPSPSWGSILNDGFSFIRQGSFLVIAAGLPIVVATIGFNFLGEAIRDILDPKSGSRS